MKGLNIIKNEAKRSAVIEIDDIIGGGWFDDKNTRVWLRNALNEITELKGKVDEIRININSPGGDVDSALAMHDLLKEFDAEIETRIYGLSASAATILAQSASTGKRYQSENALQMIHPASSGMWGKADDLRKLADTLDKVTDRIKNIYVKNAGGNEELIDKHMQAETWLTATEAQEIGLVDVVFEPEATKDLPMAALAFDVAIAEKMNMKMPSNLIPVLDEKSQKLYFQSAVKIGAFQAIKQPQPIELPKKETITDCEKERLLCLEQARTINNKKIEVI
jgi:ATP-dependent Clp endopeptidase proteolytic subunit ClpP